MPDINIIAPVFIGKFNLPIMPVHMFLLFYACMSAITPPVAVAAFAAAAIAQANPFKLAPYACKLAVGGFVLPFFFLFNTGILFQGSWMNILSDTFIGAVLTFTSTIALHGYMIQQRIHPVFIAVFVVAGLAMIYPDARLQYAAAAVVIGLFTVLHRAARLAGKPPALATA